MKAVKVAIGVIMTLIPMAMLMATPRVQLIKPPPGHYNIEELWSVTLTNPDRDTYSVWLEGTITKAEGGEVFWAQTDSFPLPPGPPKVLHYRDLHVAHQRNAPGYEEFAARTGGLPEGDYTFEVKLMPDYGSSSVNIKVKPIGPPRLISPRMGDTVRTPYPQFVWTPPMPPPSGPVTYTLKVVEALVGQTVEEAMKGNPPWFEEEGLTTSSLRYPSSARAIEGSKQYVWMVRVKFKNVDGLDSETETFCTGAGFPEGGAPLTFPRDATIVWQHRAGPGNWDIWYADYFASGMSVSTPQVLCNLSGNDMDPAVAYDRSGNTWVVWSHCDPGADKKYKILSSRRLAGSNTWSTPLTLAGSDWEHMMDPAVAFDDNGKGFCMWVAGPFSQVAFLEYSFWNGSSWSAPTLIPDDTCRLPEITFTSVPVTGQTQHAAVAIVALHSPYRMGYTAWNGSSWSNLKSLPAPGGVISTPYDYPGDKPAKEHIAIAARPAHVAVAYTRASPDASVNRRLQTLWGSYAAGNWNWALGNPAGWSVGTVGLDFYDPAFATCPCDGEHLAFARQTTSLSQLYFKRHEDNCALLKPPTAGTPGARPACTYVRGPSEVILTVWQGPGAAGATDIYWTFWRFGPGTWKQPARLNISGDDANPDVASKSGGHSMPPMMLMAGRAGEPKGKD